MWRAAVVLAACGSDAAAPPPKADLPPYQRYADLAAAIAGEVPADARVLGFGELHVRTDRPLAESALARFQRELMPQIAPQVSDLVLETWLVDPKCARAGAATAQIEATMRRPAETQRELGRQVDGARAAGVKVHALTLGCADYDRVAPATGGVDAEALLTLVTRELGRVAQSAVAYRDRTGHARPWIAVYGGALHNDRFPVESVAEWSYAAGVDAATQGRFVEIDLIVPELAAADPASASEPWFPLVSAATSDAVLAWRRGERSVVLILPRRPA